MAQEGRSLASEIGANTDMRSLQVHAVNIEGYDSSGFLRNSTINVSAANSNGQLEALSTSSGQFKFVYGQDTKHKFSQVMAYYWLNAQKNWMELWTGKFFATDKAVKVFSYVPNINNGYWDGDRKSIIIGESESGQEFSLSAEIYMHEMGHANVSYATNFRIFENLGSGKSIECGETVCCRDEKGCSWAIDEGLADYHYAMVFPQKTAMLETLLNDSGGLSECGVTREVNANASLKASDAYEACAAPHKGEVHILGRVYASAWWELRKAAEAQNPGAGAKDIDTLFTNHLSSLEGRDDFSTALAKVKASEKALFNGRYASLIHLEFGKKGIF